MCARYIVNILSYSNFDIFCVFLDKNHFGMQLVVVEKEHALQTAQKNNIRDIQEYLNSFGDFFYLKLLVYRTSVVVWHCYIFSESSKQKIKNILLPFREDLEKMAEQKKDNSIVLVSADGTEFTVKEDEAFCSKLIRRMIENEAFIESKTRRVELPLISKDVLEIIIRVSQPGVS